MEKNNIFDEDGGRRGSFRATASGLRDSWMHLLVCQQSVLLLFVFLPRLRLRVRVCVRVGEKKLSRAFRAERKNEIGKRDSLGCGIKDK